MALRDIFLNVLGGSPVEAQKTENSVGRSAARDFLINGNRDKLYPTWSDVKLTDSDMYKGYSYAVIQKRSNKVATLAKNNLKTWANPDIVDEFQKKNEQVVHPYLKIIEDSPIFTEKQFWKNISIYLDLAGRYYLGVIRSEIKPLNPNLPTITTDPTEFVMLNPYEIRRVVDKNKNVAGYIERKKDGRYREWPAYQIIEMRELNPFDPENGQWAMTDAAKNAVYTISQSGDYTRQSLNGNIDAPGIITTDVLLNDEDFANFRARVAQHRKGEPLFGNGTGAIKWDSMQIDLDKAALLDINEINRTELFAVSGTSKTSLGIEQSGTTRETARVQSEQFVSDTAQPRLEDIVDFLNLDYKRHYKLEYQKTGYYIEVESAVGKDYDTEQKAVQLKQSQFQLAQQLIQSGYTTESAYQFAEGDIDFKDLELEKGLDKPINPNQPEQPDENAPTKPQNGPTSDSGSGNDKSIVSEKESGSNENMEDLNGLEPHNDLVENKVEGEERLPLTSNGGVGSGNFGHKGRPGQIGGSSKDGFTGISFSEGAKQLFEKHPERKKEFDEVIKEFKKIGLKRGFHFTTNAYDVAAEGEGFFDVGKYSGRTVTDAAEGGSTVYVSPVLFEKGVGEKFSFEKNGRVAEVDTTFVGVLRHELGHLYMTQLFLEEAKPKGDLNQSVFERYNREFLMDSKCNRPFLGGKWSMYADINSGEAIAEAFSNPDYSEDTRKVYDYVRKYKIPEHSRWTYRGNSAQKNLLVACVGYPINDEVLKEYLEERKESNHCTCEHDHKVETFINEVKEDEGKIVDKAYKDFLQEVRDIEKETIDASVRKVTVNSFEISDIIGERKRKKLTEKLRNALHRYWWLIFPLFANSSMDKRNLEFGEDVDFVFNNALQKGVDDNALRVAEGHMETILNDILEASNRALTNVTEEAAAELIIKAYKVTPDKFNDYFDHEPTMADALSSIRKTDILEQNRKIYEKANQMAFEGYDRRAIIKAIREEYKGISENRATLIARNETSRAFTRSQFEADKQFLNGIGKLGQAYKVWYSRRPLNEQDKICDFCNEMIRMSEENPIPFEEPFLAYGDSLEVIQDNGKVGIFTANYEDIEGGCLHPNCYARDTQVYTNKGWKRVDELTGKELFWSIDPETKKPEWVKAKAKIEGYAETLLRFQNKNFDMVVTKDHNMYVESKHRDGKKRRSYIAQLREAQTIVESDRFYAGVMWDGLEPEMMKIGDYEVPAGLYCKFMGYYLSEGSANYYTYKKQYQGVISQYKHHNQYWDDLSQLPFRIWNGKTDFTFTDESVVKYCMQFGKSFEKYVPDELKQLSPRLLRIFLDAYISGDGNRKYSSYSDAYDVAMFTSSVKLRDDLTEVIQKAGYRPTVKLISKKGTPYKGTDYVSNYDVWKVSMNNKLHTIKRNTKVQEIEYHDIVYCVELEKNHTLWVMYNGKCWWSGNCQCGYHLVFKNDAGEFVKTLNGVENGKSNNLGNDSSNSGDNSSWSSEQTSEVMNGRMDARGRVHGTGGKYMVKAGFTSKPNWKAEVIQELTQFGESENNNDNER